MLGSIDLGSGRSRYVFGSASGPQRGLLTGSLTLSDVRRFAPPPMDEICGVQSPGDLSLSEGSVAGADFGGPRLLTIAADSDFDFFELFGDLDSAAAYATALYGAVSDLYLRDVGVRLELTFLRLWDQPEDLFNEPDPLIPFRDHWDETMQKVDRDAAQLLTGRRDLPYGGVAWVQAVCGPLAYSVAGYLLGSFDDPASPGSGNWDLIVSAHELGHNCGTFHTHDYGIDACAFGVAQRGTVMSYCHTTSGGVSNIDFRFHTQIQDVVESFLASQGCLIVDCNENGIADAFEFGLGMSTDRNGNGVPDECEDCNGNGVLDSSDIESGRSADVNGNGIPDDCEPDCNGNGVPDSVDLAFGGSEDLYGNGIPDECEEDCNDNGIADINEIQGQMNLDVDRNGVLDACQDCNGNGIDDLTELGGGLNLWVAGSDRPSIVEFHARSGAPVRTSDDGAIGDIQDLIIGPDGLVYVSSAATNAVASFDPDSGAYLGEFVPAGSGGLNEPAGLLFRPGGSLLVASRGTDSILEFDGATGAFLGAAVAADSGGLGAPFGLSFDLDGNLLVTTGDDRVLRFDSRTGAPLGEVVASGAGGLTLPRGLLVLPDGDLLVASSGSDAVLRYDGEDGSFLGRFDRGGLSSGFWALAEPWHLRLSVDGSLVFVSSHLGNAAIHSYDRETGLFMRTFYVLDQDIASPTGFDIRPPSSIDCNQNLLPDDCDIARNRARR